MSHQDWESVTISKKTNKSDEIRLIGQGKLQKSIEKKQSAGTNKKSTNLDTRKLENEEIGTLPVPTLELSKQIQQARTNKKITQEELNKTCNFAKGTVQKYENGTAIINSTELQQMSKVLGILLKKPKK